MKKRDLVEGATVLVVVNDDWDGRDRSEVVIILDCLRRRSKDGQRLYRVITADYDDCSFVVKHDQILRIA